MGDRPLCGAALTLTVMATPLFLHGCGEEENQRGKAEAPGPASTPIIVMGVDGLDWRVILPLLKDGRLPNLAGLMERGTYGYLDTFIPTYSPVVWTSIATGKVHQKHGIHHFARREPGGRITLYDSHDRTTKAIWNILSDYGRRITTIGWWMTYPVEEINGVMVAQTNTLDQLDTRAGKHIWKGSLLRGVAAQVFPVDRQNEMMQVLEQVDNDLPALTREIFGKLRFPLSLLGRRLWDNCQWAFRADATYLRIALKLLKERQPDLTLVYFGGPDVVGHRFWRYMDPDIYRHRPTTEQIANFGNVIEDYYAYMDRALGQLLKVSRTDVTVFVISDHGMHPVHMERRFDPDAPPANINSGEHQDAPPGVLVAAGPRIRRMVSPGRPQDMTGSGLETVASVLDVTPTLLAMMGIPVGMDMDGVVRARLFNDDDPIVQRPPPLPTHDTAEFFAGRGLEAASHPGEKERLDQLRSLGYIKD